MQIYSVKTDEDSNAVTRNTKKNYLEICASSLRHVWASSVFIIGFILSPLTWWNDLVVNLPIAWFVASVFPETWFKPAVIVSYWLTNIIGLLLMHFSGNAMIRKKVKPLTWRTFWGFMAWTSAYSLLFWLLMYFGLIQSINMAEIMEMMHR